MTANQSVGHTNVAFEKEGDLGVNSSSSREKIIVEVDEERGNWGNKCDFFLSALGYAVGLGNVWRFPMLAYKHGGGAFLIPYTIMLLFVGLPLFFLELALGQYSGAGPTRVFGRLSPALKGLGFAMLCSTFFVAIYYNVILAWTLFYVFAGFQKTLPWTTCDNPWNTPECREGGSDVNTSVALNNTSTFSYISPPEDYFNSRVMGYKHTDISWQHYGEIQWHLVGCLLGAWLIVCLSLIKGVQSSGKVVYFTAIFPFVVLVILFFRGITLDNAYEGIAYYVVPKYEKLLTSEVWQDAATQIFYSLGPAFGGLITLASYNKFDNNCHRDAVLIAFCNCGTSVFAGFVVFSILGNMAFITNQDVDKVVKGGPALAFVIFPEVVSRLPLPQLWSFLFFFMLVTLGLDSMFTFVETLTTAVLDHFKILRSKKELVVIGTCSLGFVCGISMCFSGGILMFTLIDATCASWNILLFAFLELILVSWLYGVERFFANLEEMNMKLPFVVKMYWKICWLVVTPIILAVLVLWQMFTVPYAKYAEYVFEKEVQGLGWLITLSSVVFLPLLAGRQIRRRLQKGKPLGYALFRPTPKWLPARSTALEPTKS